MNQPINLPAHGFLDDRQISYEKLTFSPETEKGSANVAQALGYRESQMVKTLVFESAAGEQVLVMLGATRTLYPATSNGPSDPATSNSPPRKRLLR
jgi:prolyl-tRNA editing enzyme YbaK/EbsC (Cys-tRNA(Pro) deacylase)